MAHKDIFTKLLTCFEDAQKSGDLLFFESTIDKHTDSDIEYEIRLCPALQNKSASFVPQNSQQTRAVDQKSNTNSEDKKPFDPFSPPYNEKLYVGELKDEETHQEFVVLLNKYSVVPQHFLLVTKEFKSQTSPLLPSELVQTYLLLSAARKSGRNFFAFYNCGKTSGASQAHKHIQFLPLLDGEDGPPIEKLAKSAQIQFSDRPFSLSQLPYANHCFRLPTNLDTSNPAKLERVLAQAFLQILDLAISTIRHEPSYPVGPPSYNVILTLDHIHIIPRAKEEYILEESGEKISVNALGYAGMLLVKSEDELEAVKKVGVSNILRAVALESVHDIQVEGTSNENPLAGLH